VLMSLVVRELSETLPLAAAVAVCEALPVESQIKWPNDVWIDGRKVAGILVEARPQEGWAVLGIGLNVAIEEFPPPLDETATSLQLAGAALSVDEALAALVASLSSWLSRPAEEVLAAWRPRDALIGRSVRWENGSKEGAAAGIDSSGALIVDTADGRITLDAGEVHFER
jgi:BirA family transcriptional regulator, biotin operon repressor / biotin---[acetyl-CoA-carboxylase] ligase